MTAPRPGLPYAAPRGHRWVPAAAGDACAVDESEPGRDRKCRARRAAGPQHGNPCNAGAVALVAGQYRCANHLDGRWVEHGVVMTWELEVENEEDV